MDAATPRFYYNAFGLTLSVPFECRQLGECAMSDPGRPSENSVVVEWRKVPRDLSGAQTRSAYFVCDSNRCLISLDSIAGARFLMEGGRTISIDAPPSPDLAAIRTFLLGPCMGALLHQRESLALHAAAVSFRGDTYVFAGASATGKSTISAALRQRGGTVLADGICVLAPGPGGTFLAKSGVTAVELWPDAVDKLGLCTSELAPLRRQVSKRSWAPGPVCRADHGTVKTIYVLEPEGADASDELRCRTFPPARGASGFESLQAVVYGSGYAVGQRRHERLFLQIGELAQTVAVRRVPGSVSSRGFRRLDAVVEEVVR